MDLFKKSCAIVYSQENLITMEVFALYSNNWYNYFPLLQSAAKLSVAMTKSKTTFIFVLLYLYVNVSICTFRCSMK